MRSITRCSSLRDLADARSERRGERLGDGLAELGAHVGPLEEDRRGRLSVGARRKEDEGRVDAVDVAEGVEGELERLPAQQLRRARTVAFPSAIEHADPSPQSVYMTVFAGADRVDVRRLGAARGRVGLDCERAAPGTSSRPAP